MDKGPWGVRADPQHERVWVFSDDFTHDVILQISGDFADYAQRTAYAEWLARKLNGAPRGVVRPLKKMELHAELFDDPPTGDKTP